MKKKYQVGGVIYEILKTPQQQKPFDIKSITSMVHEPVVVEEVMAEGYTPKYTFNRSGEQGTASNNATIETKPAITQLTFDVQTPIETIDTVPVATTVTPTSIDNFHTTLYNAFIKAGVNERVARFMVAQDSLETGDGKHHAGKYNYGNITAGSSWKGSTTSGRDKDASGNNITQRFRNYDSIDHYASDKKSLLSSSRYQCSMNANTIEEYARCVKAGGYAEDPQYEQKLINKYHSLYG